jgi:hypothetical protein
MSVLEPQAPAQFFTPPKRPLVPQQLARLSKTLTTP